MQPPAGGVNGKLTEKRPVGSLGSRQWRKQPGLSDACDLCDVTLWFVSLLLVFQIGNAGPSRDAPP